MKRIMVRLPEELYERLVDESVTFGIAPAVLARAYVKQGLDRRSDLAAAIAPVIEPEPSHQSEQPPEPATSNRRRPKKRKNSR